jgi:hypothetical protein
MPANKIPWNMKTFVSEGKPLEVSVFLEPRKDQAAFILTYNLAEPQDSELDCQIDALTRAAEHLELTMQDMRKRALALKALKG